MNTNAFAVKLGVNKHPFHLARSGTEVTHGDAARGPIVMTGKQEATLGRGELSWQAIQFCIKRNRVEVLIDKRRFCTVPLAMPFDECTHELAHLRDLRGACCSEPRSLRGVAIDTMNTRYGACLIICESA